MSKQKHMYNIETQNRFSMLTDEAREDNDISDMETEDDNKKEENNTHNVNKKKKLPPLVLHGKVKDHVAFVGLIKQSVENNFHIKYHEDNVEVFLYNKKDYETLSTAWKSKNIKYHTYTSKEEKRRTYIIKGLHAYTKPEEIKEDLEASGIIVHNISLMKGTKKPIFMVTTSMVKLTLLMQKVQYVCYTKVEWDNYINKRRIAQCHRCQEWGHATMNCYADPACLKCAGEHLTKDCKKPKTEPAKCANCLKDHPANATICDTYIRRLDRITKIQDKTKIRNKELGRQRKDLGLDDTKQYPQLRPVLENRQAWAYNDSSKYNNKIIDIQKDTEVNINKNKNMHYSENDFKDFLILIDEIKKINTKFNIKNMLRSVKTLNEQLEKCNNQIEKFQVFAEFCQSLETSCMK